MLKSSRDFSSLTLKGCSNAAYYFFRVPKCSRSDPVHPVDRDECSSETSSSGRLCTALCPSKLHQAYHEKLREFHPDKRPESRGETGARVAWIADSRDFRCKVDPLRSHKQFWTPGRFCRSEHDSVNRKQAVSRGHRQTASIRRCLEQEKDRQ